MIEACFILLLCIIIVVILLIIFISSNNVNKYQYFKGNDSGCKFESENLCNTSIVSLSSGLNTTNIVDFSYAGGNESIVEYTSNRFIFLKAGLYKISYNIPYFISGGGYSTTIQTYMGKLINDSFDNHEIIKDSIAFGVVEFDGDYQNNTSEFVYRANKYDTVAIFIKYLNITDIVGPEVFNYSTGNKFIIEKMY
jgi:hypothetical protein